MAVPGGARRGPLLLLLLLLGLVQGASAVFVVRDGNGTACIMASFSAAFLTSYDTKNGSKNVTFELPASAKVSDSSSCGKGGASDSSLVIVFGRGHTLTLNFTRNATRYSVQLMRFVYNLSDSEIFPNSSSKEVKTVKSVTDIKADMNKKYRCVSGDQIHMGNVTVTLRNATIQAYVSNNSFSGEETRCTQDGPSPPTPTPPPPQPSPTPAPQSPWVSKYSVNGTNGTCLLASMGLQLNVTYRLKDNTTVTREFNINPNKTTYGGNCTAQLVTLEIHSGNLSLALQFAMNATSRQVFLQGVLLGMTLPDASDPAFQASNTSLRALQATTGNSYKCNAEERVQVTKAFSLNIFRVWVQAFRVDGGKFGPVEECQLDENSMLIPIAVGGALAGLVLIVLIAYLIGRKRSHAGYQTI
ncbi:lysosome-associated membrane glycoprotein 1 [Hippopotamus amphibius kiboko]|uniref:lysosome-associated membrane glycoprotein 1 n=1 Tax=Hippopotamus amphibius kiboko TaxID=575201 RepID=UPI002593949F|nr:lysosome-associated membrane glycoprotein 1 [Hippopotamus amphibius kiboko]